MSSEQELQEEFLLRDTRSFTTKVAHWARKPQNMALLISSHAAVAFMAPGLSDIAFLMVLPLFLWAMTRKEHCPLKMPKQSGLLDENQPHPATGKPTKADGIFFLGNEMKTGKEVWLTNSDCRQHFLVIGTTGAGKTETLLGFAANALTWGSGLLFCDGKGDVSVFSKLYALTRRFGREDDLLVLNFMTGNSDIGASGGKIKSNTINPFSTGSSDSLTQMIASLMEDAGGDGAIWKGRATAMLTGVMRALCWLRDNGVVDLNVGVIRDYMNLKKVIDLADEKKFPEMPPDIRGAIKSYLGSLPGYQEEKGYNQGTTTRDQHGYLEMQFTKILASLADVYGHIFKTEYGEVDMTDVVLNRRILFIMLPALEKSGDELANLGKIVVANLKGMMGSTLGSDIEGTWFDVVENRQTTSPAPYMAVLDEVGYYAVDGLALMAAQARSLGFSMVYATQDIPALERRNEKEAASITANTNTKVFMRTEETEKSGKLAIDAAGKALKAQVSGFQGQSGEIGIGYRDSMEAKLELADRLNFRDLKQQGEGEMHIIFQDRVIRAQGFYANPEGALDTKKVRLRANHFIKVAPPDMDALESDDRAPEILEKLLDAANIKKLKADAARACKAAEKDAVDEIAQTARAIKAMEAAKRNPVEAASGALGAVIAAQKESVQAFNQAVRRKSGLSALGEAPRPESDSVPIKPRRDANKFASLQEAFESSKEEAGHQAPVAVERRTASPGDTAKDEQVPKGTRRSAVRDVPHGATVDDGDVIDMARNLESNDAIMRALAAMHFDTDSATPDEVGTAVDEALAPRVSGEGEESVPSGDDIALASGDLDASLADIMEDDDAFTTVEEDGDGSQNESEAPADGGSDEMAESFLRSLLMDEDEEE